MKKRGKKPAMKQVHLYAEAHQITNWKNAAELDERSFATWARRVLDAEAKRVLPPTPWYAKADA